MSGAVLAAISGLQRTIQTKLGLTRRFSFIAGEEITKGSFIAVGSDGKAYRTVRTPDYKLLTEAGYWTNNLNGGNEIYLVGAQRVSNTAALALFNNSSCDDNSSNEWSLDLILAYLDANGNLKTLKKTIKTVDGYSYSNSYNYSYNSIHRAILHKIDDTHFLIAWQRSYYSRSGSSSSNTYNYNNWIEAVVVTVENNRVNVGQVKSYSYDTGSTRTRYYPYYYCFFPITNTEVFFCDAYEDKLFKITVNADYTVSISQLSTSVSISYFYDAVVPLANGGIMAIEGFSNTSYYRDIITSPSATDFVRKQITSNETLYSAEKSIPLDVGKVIAYDQGNLVVLEYDGDGNFLGKKTVSCDFDTGIVDITNNGQNVMPYKDAEGNIYLALSTWVIPDVIYEDTNSNNRRYNRNVIVVKISQDADGNYSAKKVGWFADLSWSPNLAPHVTKLGDYFLVFSGAYRDYHGTQDIAALVTLQSENSVTTTKVNMYAINSAQPGETVEAETPEIPIDLGLATGQRLGSFVGIGKGLALKEVK